MIGLPVPTHWLDVHESPPPEDVWLFLYANIPKDEGQGMPPILCGYYSSRTECFVDVEFRCLNEMFDITMYSVATTPSGGVIEVDRG